MMTTTQIEAHVRAIETDGITALPGAFARQWAEQLREDMMTAFWDAIQRPGGAVGRGPRRWYVEVHPQQISGFVELVTHPWVAALSAEVLSPDYETLRDRARDPLRRRPLLDARDVSAGGDVATFLRPRVEEVSEAGGHVCEERGGRWLT